MSPGVLLLLGAAALGLYRLLPRNRAGRPFGSLPFLLVGFVLTQAVLSAAIAALGLVPKGPYRDLLHEMTAERDRRPVLLLIGSSFTEAGIDPEELAADLDTTGSSVAVHRLAVGGSPHLERLHYLKEYLARSDRNPKLALFEIAGGYDSGPLYQIHQMRFTDRMIAMMDGSSAGWALRWIADANRLRPVDRAVLAGEILAQLGLHVSHLGSFWNSAPVSAPADHEDGGLPPIRLSEEEIGQRLDQAAAARELRPEWPQDVPTPWMSALLTAEMTMLRRHGVERFAFYSVPSMQGANVAYARRFCAAMSKFPCVVGEDPNLLARLREGRDWRDFDHLQGTGRELFTRWLGDRLVESGVWP